jgi:cation:H+ antiporter
MEAFEVDATTLGWLVAGLLLLFSGAESLVRGAAALARRIGISPLVVGVTVVAYGTSAPELVVSSTAALRGQDDVAVGNVVGSNIFNILFILGLSALVRPLTVAQQLVFRDVPVMIAVSLLFWLLTIDGRLGMVEGVLFLGSLALFSYDAVRTSRRESATVADEYASGAPPAPRHAALALGAVAIGLALLVVGSRWLVSSAIAVAEAVGVDQTVIALTLVAAGTGLPEVATSLVATLRGQRDIAVGNVVGSNVFNLLGILGLSALLGRDLAVAPAFEHFDTPFMVAVALACLPLIARRHEITRAQGGFLLAAYAAYVTYLELAAKQHAGLAPLSAVLLEFAIPMIVAALVALVYAQFRGRPGRREAP